MADAKAKGNRVDRSGTIKTVAAVQGGGGRSEAKEKSRGPLKVLLQLRYFGGVARDDQEYRNLV